MQEPILRKLENREWVYLSLILGYKPCQLHPWIVLLLLKFCCWYCCTAVPVVGLVTTGGFLVGKSSAAILLTHVNSLGGFNGRGSGNLLYLGKMTQNRQVR